MKTISVMFGSVAIMSMMLFVGWQFLPFSPHFRLQREQWLIADAESFTRVEPAIADSRIELRATSRDGSRSGFHGTERMPLTVNQIDPVQGGAARLADPGKTMKTKVTRNSFSRGSEFDAVRAKPATASGKSSSEASDTHAAPSFVTRSSEPQLQFMAHPGSQGLADTGVEIERMATDRPSLSRFLARANDFRPPGLSADTPASQQPATQQPATQQPASANANSGERASDGTSQPVDPHRLTGLTVPAGFEVTLVADDRLAHDIFSMTLDSAGQVVVSGPGYIKRLHDDDGDGRADRSTRFTDHPTSGAKGMVFDRDDLVYTGDNGVWRLTDRDGDGFADGAPQRWAEVRNPEHGANGVVQGPDGWFYVICGNDTGVTAHHATTDRSPVREPQSGVILRFAPDGSACEIVAHGFRNAYDLDFHAAGQLFTVDSDGERDQHLPWYSPTRLFDIAPGQHHGWVLSGWQRSWNRPAWFPDTVPRLLEIGRGSPTGLVVYRHHQFPDHYQGAIFSCCWTLGRVYCFPLQPEGSSYTSQVELFLQTSGTTGFAPVDLAVDPSGDLLVAIGGRGTQGGIFRVRYRGEQVPQPKSESSVDGSPRGGTRRERQLEPDPERESVQERQPESDGLHEQDEHHGRYTVSMHSKQHMQVEPYMHSKQDLYNHLKMDNKQRSWNVRAGQNPAYAAFLTMTGAARSLRLLADESLSGDASLWAWTSVNRPHQEHDTASTSTLLSQAAATGHDTGELDARRNVSPESLPLAAENRMTPAFITVEALANLVTTVGAAAPPVAAATPLQQVLQAPQPLSAWSRARWLPLTRQLGAAPFVEVLHHESSSVQEKVRAVEILTECFDGIPAESLPTLVTSDPTVLQRVAWSVGRRRPGVGVAAWLAKLTFHADPRVQRAAWESLAVVEPELPAQLAADWSDLEAGCERRIRLAALAADARSRVVETRVESPLTHLWRLAARDALPENALRSAADALIAAHARIVAARATAASAQKQKPVDTSSTQAQADEGDTTRSPEKSPGMRAKQRGRSRSESPGVAQTEDTNPSDDERLVAVRVLQLALGDVLSQSAEPETMAGYEAAALERVSAALRTEIARDLLAIFPTGERNLDRELARLFAMLRVEDRSLIERLATQLAAGDRLLDQLHGLMVLSRLPGERKAASRLPIVKALLQLDQQLLDESRLPSRNWPLRVAEMYNALQKHDPLLPAAVAVDDRLVRPGQAWIVPLLPRAEREYAARRLLGAIEAAEDETLFTDELLPVAAALPVAEAAPIVRRLWEEPQLRDAATELLAREPQPVDRPRFLAGLRSVQLATVQRAAEALSQLAPADLPRDRSSTPSTSQATTPALTKPAPAKPAPANPAPTHAAPTNTAGKANGSAQEWTAILLALRQVCSPSTRETPEQQATRESLEHLLVKWTGRPSAAISAQREKTVERDQRKPGPPESGATTPRPRLPKTEKVTPEKTRSEPSDAVKKPGKASNPLPPADSVRGFSAPRVYAYWFAWIKETFPDEAAKLTAFAQADTIDWPARIAALDWTMGDVNRGKEVFQRRACARCHAGQGRLGPDLAGAANRFSREDLFAAILDPSREVAPLYRLTQVITAAGRVFTGILVYESPEGTLIQTAPDQIDRIAGDEIVTMQKVSQSLMPNGLLNASTDQELADLYAFLRSL
jgi:putative membrane-bound dehydrogenase-like protein